MYWNKEQELLSWHRGCPRHGLLAVSSFPVQALRLEGKAAGHCQTPFPGMLTVVTTTAFLFLSSRQRRSLDQLLLKINNAFKAGAGAPNCDKGQGGGAEDD